MERKVGETFEFIDVTLKVVKSYDCTDCYFYKEEDLCFNNFNTTGNCCIDNRKDNKAVIFRELK